MTKKTTISPYEIRKTRCIKAGKKAGCPRDQVRNLAVLARYYPYRWQWRFHAAAREADQPDGPTEIGLGGARGPGKSHGVMSQAALDDCQRVEGLKCLFLRKTGTTAQESFDDLITKAVRGRVEYRKSKVEIRFPNGSRIVLGGFKDENDIDKYIGIEYDLIIIEELTQLTFVKYQKVLGSLRTSKPGWRPRMYTSFNPGGIGHVWVRERFVMPYRAGTNIYIDPDTKKPTVIRFIPSTYKENPALNPEYLAYLESLGGNLGKAWREGEWDVFEGQYFGEWSYEQHVVAPFKIPETWFRFRSIDPSGRSGTTSCHWYAVDHDGRVWCYREYFKSGLDIDEHAKNIAKLSLDKDGVVEAYRYTVMDTAAFAKAGYSETAAEIYERNGVNGLLPAAKERVVGWNAVHTFLRWSVSTPPKLKIFSICANLIREIPLAQHDERHPDDVASVRKDAEHGDALDDLRYFLRTLRETTAPKPLSAVERRLREMQESETTTDYSYMRK